MTKIDKAYAKRVGREAYRLVRDHGRIIGYILEGPARHIVEYECRGLTLELRSPAPVGAAEPLEKTARPTEFELIISCNDAKLLRIASEETRSAVTHFAPGDWERGLYVAAERQEAEG
jgi:hypothetical protein